MKLLFFCIIFPAFKIAFSQQQNTLKVTLLTSDCRVHDDYALPEADSLFIYRIQENSIVVPVIRRNLRHHSIELNLPESDYRIVFKNNFCQQAIKIISVRAGTLNRFMLCPDSLVSYPENTLARLKNGESLTINYQFFGCVSSYKHTILIKKKGNVFEGRSYINKPKENPNPCKATRPRYKIILLNAKILTPEDILAFIRFENELRGYHSGGCTITDYYTVKSKYLNLNIEDGSCIWKGYFRLNKIWFKKG